MAKRSTRPPVAGDKIFIHAIRTKCVIGLNDWERKIKQKIVIDIELHVDLKRAGSSDDIRHSVDYKSVCKKIVDAARTSRYFLVEALAERVAAICLEPPLVRAARVILRKPGALSDARCVGVDITRRRRK